MIVPGNADRQHAAPAASARRALPFKQALRDFMALSPVPT
jgi:hypothetical protein